MKKKQQERDREHAIESYLQGESITAISQKLGYGRPWVYKWIERYQASGEATAWQAEQNRRPHGNSRKLPSEVVEAVKLVARRHAHAARLHIRASFSGRA